ncbi:MAG: hypothetical protein C4523_01725 [Myxococcales bacterium]|nr:MAG: hypothetical protein C4523_01725 [Myxococcales bacterium]
MTKSAAGVQVRFVLFLWVLIGGFSVFSACASSGDSAPADEDTDEGVEGDGESAPDGDADESAEQEEAAEVDGDADPEIDGDGDDSEEDESTEPPTPIAEQTFAAFEPWATPIEDFIAVGEEEDIAGFYRGIHELMPYNDRLYIGYGDGTYNLGEYVPIEFRYFASPDDTQITSEFASSEEQIDRYRILDGELYQAGIDAIDADEIPARPLIIGNVYRWLADGGWRKYRSIPGAEHVEDVASFDGAIFAVGSGADNRSEWDRGQIFRYLWRSDDRGESFTTVTRSVNQTFGNDTRWVHLLPAGDSLFLFGYRMTGADSGVLVNARFDGGTVEELPTDDPLDAFNALDPVYALGTYPLPDGTGLLIGVDVSLPPDERRLQMWHIAADGTPTVVSELAGKTIVDVSVREETAEILYLVYEGDGLLEEPNPFPVSVLVAPASSPGSTTTLATFETELRPRSIAFWQGALFYGNDVGEIWKAAGAP